MGLSQVNLLRCRMYLVAIAWMYVVLMMSVAEATNSNGTVLGALFTVLLYGLLPLGIVLYLLRTPGRRKAQRSAQRSLTPEGSGAPPDDGDHAAGDAVAPVRKEP